MYKVSFTLLLLIISINARADFAISCSDDEFSDPEQQLTKETIVVDSGRGQFMLQATYLDGQENKRYHEKSSIYWLPIRRAVTKTLEYVYTQNHHFESDISSIAVDRRVGYIKIKYTSDRKQVFVENDQRTEKIVGERIYEKNCRVLDDNEKQFILNIAKTLQERSRKYGDESLNDGDSGKPKI